VELIQFPFKEERLVLIHFLTVLLVSIPLRVRRISLSATHPRKKNGILMSSLIDFFGKMGIKVEEKTEM